jgi:hypothetical protein
VFDGQFRELNPQVVPLTLLGAAYCAWSTAVAIYMPGVRLVSGAGLFGASGEHDHMFAALLLSSPHFVDSKFVVAVL